MPNMDRTEDFRRILVIDDEPAAHADYRSVLEAAAPGPGEMSLDSLEGAMFGGANRQQVTGFSMSSAHQGREGLEMVRDALARQEPYAVAFVDMRMPPGLDGLQTAKALWSLDSRLQIVICTAYSDHSWHDMLRELQPNDQLLVVKKPFDPIEIWQAATALSAHWSRDRQCDAAIATLQQQLNECVQVLQGLPPSSSQAPMAG